MTLMTDRSLLTRADDFVGRIKPLVVDEPRDRSILRRTVGLSPQDPRMLPAHAIVAEHVRDADDDATERAFYAVAGLIAAQPRSARDLDGDADDPDTSEEGDEVRSGTAVPDDQDTKSRGADAATDRRPPKRPNLGVTLGTAVAKGVRDENSTTGRLHLLCRQRTDGLHRALLRVVMHLRSDRIPIDWAVLLRDLARWERERDLVAKEWVQGYHRTIETERARREEARAQNTTTDDSEDHAA